MEKSNTGVNSRVLSKTDNQIVLDEGKGYKLRATATRIGAFGIIAIDWEHPNFGYFADGMLCFRSLHMRDWDAIPIVKWTWKYKKDNKFRLKKFLKDYPELKEFFDLKVSLWTVLWDEDPQFVRKLFERK